MRFESLLKKKENQTRDIVRHSLTTIATLLKLQVPLRLYEIQQFIDRISGARCHYKRDWRALFVKISWATKFGQVPGLIIEKRYRRGGKKSRTFSRDIARSCLMAE